MIVEEGHPLYLDGRAIHQGKDITDQFFVFVDTASGWCARYARNGDGTINHEEVEPCFFKGIEVWPPRPQY